MTDAHSTFDTGDAWRADAGCRGLDVDADQIPTVVCDGCSVRLQCLSFALEHRIPTGRWGGHTPLERADLLAEAGFDAGEAMLISARVRDERDAHARRGATASHPSHGGSMQLGFQFPPPAQLGLDL